MKDRPGTDYGNRATKELRYCLLTCNPVEVKPLGNVWTNAFLVTRSHVSCFQRTHQRLGVSINGEEEGTGRAVGDAATLLPVA